MKNLRLVRVAVPVPLADTFDYRWEGSAARPPPGSRVSVPFGRGERIGVVVEHPSHTALPEAKLKAVRAALDPEPLIAAELFETLAWAAGYYHHPIGEVLSHALPGLLRKRPQADKPPARYWRLAAAAAAAAGKIERRAPQQSLVLEALAGVDGLAEEELRRRGAALATLRRLAAKGWIEAAEATDAAARTKPAAQDERHLCGSGLRAATDIPALTTEQQAALGAIAADGDGYRCYLLHGATGSGKTEVYLRLISEQLAAGRQTLLLVPEIGLTPQLVGRLERRFGGALAVLHSGLTDRERLDAWHAARGGDAKVVVGTRSAVFAPLPAAGLVIVDEEHDPSFKQQTGFRYSARDLAVLRAQRLNVPVLLGSATPALESFHNARLGRYRLLSMPTRIGAGGPPSIRLVDLGRHASRQALSTPLLTRIERHLAAGNQVMLFLNRRGFAPALFCPECGDTADCGRCDARLTVHSRAGKLRCHHCGSEQPLSWSCARCGNERLAVGAGTQRIDMELAALFPDVRIARLDRDAVTRKGALATVLDDVATGKTQILVGTQMLTKGHDFSRVTLVGVLSADQGLFGTDFRSHERLAQTILQVAGRAGRRDMPGEVVIQTHHPGHPLLKSLLAQDYHAFAAHELDERRRAAWPPFAHVAAWRAEASERRAAFALLERLCAAAAPRANGVRILGPAAAAMERRDGRYRAQLLFVAEQRAPLRELLASTVSVIRSWPEARRARWSLDVDPVEV